MLSDGRIRWLAEVALRSFVTVAVVETAIRTAVAEAVAAERQMYIEIVQSECGAAHIVAIGQDIVAAILARGEDEQDAEQ